MEHSTIRAVCARYGLSTRTLRYWEQIGLIESVRVPEYAYRVYTPEMVQRVGQILALRSLQLPLRDIAAILDAPTEQRVLEILQENIRRLDRETESLQTVRHALTALTNRVFWLGDRKTSEAKEALPMMERLMPLAQAPTDLDRANRKEHMTMEDWKKAAEDWKADRMIRYISLPPMTVAAAQYTGECPENEAGARLDRFVEASGLVQKMPGLRVFGFNNPAPAEADSVYGYEFWVTIPEDMDVPAPLEKKHFAGGLYAAYTIRMGDFHEWGTFMEKLRQDPQYEMDTREPAGMGGCLEEHLNALSYYAKPEATRAFTQLDLLVPVREKEA